MKLVRTLLPLAILLLSGCTKNISTNEAVRQGVIKHLSQNKGLQVSSMDIEISSVTFKDNEADATVSFKPKGGAATSGMQMRYTLEKQGGEWVVKKKADSGTGHAGPAMPAEMPASPHGGGMGAPAATPAGEMPPNHPPMGKAASGATPEPKK